ncbi:3693_t:CDS:2 [Dentiscutata heterogama]|uniref:3693_t:CDS:1 n=1 Tax=Dentiscutata heterogama TaxID=1316150 RepID=A0ACA9LDJ9_9GLOM|nr:3693_t:CDS:2 [Dentiscutata heterogama]
MTLLANKRAKINKRIAGLIASTSTQIRKASERLPSREREDPSTYSAENITLRMIYENQRDLMKQNEEILAKISHLEKQFVELDDKQRGRKRKASKKPERAAKRSKRGGKSRGTSKPLAVS